MARLFLVALPFLFSTASWACFCAQETPPQKFKHADLVFQGQLVIEDNASTQQLFTIKKLIKGRLKNQTQIRLDTGQLSSCGLKLDDKQPLIIFAHKQGTGFSTNKCNAINLPLPEFLPMIPSNEPSS